MSKLQKNMLIQFLNYVSLSVFIVLVMPMFLIIPVIKILIGKKIAYKVQIFWMRIWLVCFGISRRCRIHPDIDKNECYIYMSEHFSAHDIPLWKATIPNEAYGLSAREFANVPVYGWILHLMGTHFIERRNARQAMADLEAVSMKMKQDQSSLLLVPTGTRASNADLLPFKRGVFQFAASLKYPIVPVYLIGIEHLILGKNFIRPGRVEVVCGAPILPEEHPEAFSNRESLLVLVRERMQHEGGLLRNNVHEWLQAINQSKLGS